MTIEQVHAQAEDKMKHTIDALHREYGGVRTGRASISILDGIKVDYYGSQVPINQVANLSIPDPRQITIQPWDTTLIKDIEKAILKSDLGLTPNNDGKLIRLPIPSLTEERRKQLVKVVKRMAEECRISIRNSRREAIEVIKKLEKDKEIPEDNSHKAQDKIQKLTDDYAQQINTIQEHKEQEVMEI
jgi:ribosome recycling factor